MARTYYRSELAANALAYRDKGTERLNGEAAETVDQAIHDAIAAIYCHASDGPTPVRLVSVSVAPFTFDGWTFALVTVVAEECDDSDMTQRIT